MKGKAIGVFTGVLTAAAIATTWIIAVPGLAQTVSPNLSSGPRDPGVRPLPPAAGLPLPGLTTGQRNAFEEGKDAFEEIAFVRNPPAGGDAGLGPGFNSDSCLSCHAFPTTGGTSPFVNPQVEVATRLGANNSVPSFVTQNGPVREVRFQYNRDGSRDGGVHNLFTISGRSDARGCDARQEDFSNRSNLSFRIPTPTFGLGLVEALSETTLKSNLSRDAGMKAFLGITGRLNVNGNDGTSTRFGWKAQNKSLQIFAAEAYNVEQGVTNPLFPQERGETPGCMYNPTAEDTIDFDLQEQDDVALFAAFMRFLAPPSRGPVNASVNDGAAAFASVGCALCHTPTLRTSTSSVAALSEQTVAAYSDFALHRMGPGLADDIVQGVAQGDEFRTAPLWGLGQRIFFLHDGRTKDLLEAIRAHSGDGNGQFQDSEANAVLRRFNQLPAVQQQNILNFLRSL